MAVEQMTFRRLGITYTSFLGIDETGQSVDYLDSDETDPTGLQVRYEPDETLIKRGGKGRVAYILTKYRRGLVAPSGEIIQQTATVDVFQTTQQDLLGFIAGMGMPIMKSGNNGFIRNWKGALHRFFDPVTGAPVTGLTTEQENELLNPPTEEQPPADADTPNP